MWDISICALHVGCVRDDPHAEAAGKRLTKGKCRKADVLGRFDIRMILWRDRVQNYVARTGADFVGGVRWESFPVSKWAGFFCGISEFGKRTLLSKVRWRIRRRA